MNVPCDLLLHPEFLTNEQLRHIIMQRHLKIPNIEHMQRDDLLELFHQFCVPYGQRKYRDSGRGKILNKTRHLSPETPPKFNTMDSCSESRKISRSWSNDRIKPPPDLLSGHMKRIKLENKTPTVNKDVYIKRKMSVDGDTQINESPPPKKDRKPITWP